MKFLRPMRVEMAGALLGAYFVCASEVGSMTNQPENGLLYNLPESEWRRRLTPQQYKVLRQKGTEPPFSGAFWNHHAPGIYLCAGCGQGLFRSTEKFDSGTGWPSFWQPIAGRVITRLDRSHGMMRLEVLCSTCGGHLGHVFDDGPPPTGLRYCINSTALMFRPDDSLEGPSSKPRPAK